MRVSVCFPVCSVFVVERGLPGKKLKINLRVREKLLTFAVPNETGLIRTCGAMLRGIERGSVVAGFAPCCGTSAEARAEAGKFLKDIDIHVA